jgi:GcrA cell cycle regulator
MSAAPDAIDARIIALRQSGLFWAEVAAELGITQHKVWWRVEKMRKAGCTIPAVAAYVTHSTDWPAREIATLRRLWDEGVSTNEIGRRMGLTKNAIVGKAHRLDLSERESPIIRSGPITEAGHRRKARRAAPPPVGRAATLPALASVQEAPAPRPAEPPAPHVPPRTVPRDRPAAQPAMARSGRVVTCCWPIGEPGKRDGPTAFRFCDVPSDPGKPYCADHCRKAYQPRQTQGAVA